MTNDLCIASNEKQGKTSWRLRGSFFLKSFFFFYKRKSQLNPKNYLKEVIEAVVYENQLSSVQK